MTRRLAIVATMLATASVTGLFSGVSIATGEPEPFCTYQLAPPQLTQMPGGGEVMTSRLVTTACPGRANPTISTVCITTPEGPGDCATTFGWETAHVFVTASRYTGTFTAKGQGCWSFTAGRHSACAAIGPVSTTI